MTPPDPKQSALASAGNLRHTSDRRFPAMKWGAVQQIRRPTPETPPDQQKPCLASDAPQPDQNHPRPTPTRQGKRNAPPWIKERGIEAKQETVNLNAPARCVSGRGIGDSHDQFVRRRDAVTYAESAPESC